MGMLSNLFGVFGSSNTALGLLGGGFVIGLIVMWWFKGLFKTQEVIFSSALLTAVKEANEMVSLRSYFQDVIEDRKVTTFLGIPGSSKCLLIWRGEIECRFNMSKTDIKADNEAKRVSIIMPLCELKVTADVSGVKLYSIEKGWYDWAADKFVSESEVRYNYNEINDRVKSAKEKIKEDADKEWHLKDKAKENARHVLENMAKAFGYTAQISFSDDFKNED